jgi:ribonuclease HII
MKSVIGIDEVGRGPLAGPVAVCAFTFQVAGFAHLVRKTGLPLRDSKKLSRAQREEWFAHIESWQRGGLCDFKITMISAKEIDKIGISHAIKKALAQSLAYLAPLSSAQILLDGGLRAPEHFKKQKTIIKGDEKEPMIALASIAAKVTRDRYMLRQAKTYPVYGFEQHMGYGTRVHREAIVRHGPSPLHRKSFLKKLHNPLNVL